ncbi:MAG: ornithine aminomutase subunit alpha [Halarsenatibacteraceae bacterium]
MSPERKDDYQKRREHLADLSDQELKDKFWERAEQVVDPLADLAKTHTSPSIERSVLIRMGFNSLDAKAIVKKIHEADLLGKGAGHVVLKLSKKEEMEIKEAGLAIKDGKYSDNELADLFSGGVA